MATTISECEQMIAAAAEAKRKLMVAYRLHYEPINMRVMEWCRDKKFGPVRSIISAHCQDVPAPNIRLSSKLGGGPLGDVGIYSLNATRYITGEEATDCESTAPKVTQRSLSRVHQLRRIEGVLRAFQAIKLGPNADRESK